MCAILKHFSRGLFCNLRRDSYQFFQNPDRVSDEAMIRLSSEKFGQFIRGFND